MSRVSHHQLCYCAVPCNFGPASQTLAQHYASIGPMYRVIWSTNANDNVGGLHAAHQCHHGDKYLPRDRKALTACWDNVEPPSNICWVFNFCRVTDIIVLTKVFLKRGLRWSQLLLNIIWKIQRRFARKGIVIIITV